MLKMKYPCYFINRLNNAIIKLNFIIVDSVIIAGGCIKFIQVPDVSWNKPMKEYLRKIYDNWLAEVIKKIMCALSSNLDGSEDQIMSQHSQNSFNLVVKLPDFSPTLP